MTEKKTAKKSIYRFGRCRAVRWVVYALLAALYVWRAISLAFDELCYGLEDGLEELAVDIRATEGLWR